MYTYIGGILGTIKGTVSENWEGTGIDLHQSKDLVKDYIISPKFHLIKETVLQDFWVMVFIIK